MKFSQRFLIGTLLCAGVFIATSDRAIFAQRISDEARLIDVLKSDAPKSQKAITCKRLAVYGTHRAVPELAKLLYDEELTSWARTALEVLPHESADEALREAMASLSGRSLIGVINSIGVRRDALAVESLARHLQSNDQQVAVAAAVALGHIANPAATETLQRRLAYNPPEVRDAVAIGCILIAERILHEGNHEQAGELYDQVRHADVSKQRLLEATRGVIMARKSAALLAEQLRSPDNDFFAIGVRTAGELPGGEVTSTLVSALDNVTATRQKIIVQSLAQRDRKAVLPAVLDAATSGPDSVRISSVEVLGRVGDASCVPVLLRAAVADNTVVAQAAKDALAAIQDDAVDELVIEKLADADGPLRTVLIEVVGERRIEATDQLIDAANDANGNVRAAALAALGSTIGPDNLSVLIGRVTDPTYSGDAEVAVKALNAASIRMPDREAVAAQLSGALPNASVDVQQAVLEILGNVGGSRALATVAKAASEERDAIKDTASQVLGKWATSDAAPVLLRLAQPKADEKYRIRALRGYLRIARQMKLTNAQRAQMCEAALPLADRDAERELILQVLEIHPSVDALLVALNATKLEGFQQEADRTALAISGKVGGDAEAVRRLLENGLLKPAEIEIVQATYGIGETTKDVTEIVRKSVGQVPLISLSSPAYNASFGGDPAPGQVKQLVIKYKLNGLSGTATFSENALILLPTR